MFASMHQYYILSYTEVSSGLEKKKKEKNTIRHLPDRGYDGRVERRLRNIVIIFYVVTTNVRRFVSHRRRRGQRVRMTIITRESAAKV